ncbi:hypothetical protein [Hydrogenophaga sp. PBL-H3]|uniref:hypothetical protein n=1 Tax=Hydrogenophaga sp. PBL-H3 TaxID=434010 RepID=UPI00131FA148|nr:hypothetical protein [Hydrogenophaga sp. PBL-H3]QHE78163.1 hypothetical protein F9Z45_20060 [Hydrogenophaga sp. PBL-H3]QHE82588.1 hypothetical protein F9Z44_20060 [Hydrogenophaga sp. PBL-H3]
MKRARRCSTPQCSLTACVALLLAAQTSVAHAWSLEITSGARRLFLHVGDGALSGQQGTLNGPAGTSGIVNTVQVSPSVNELLSGAALTMTSNSTQSVSLYGGGNITCPTPERQVMIGAGYRRNNGSGNAVLTVTSPSNLINLATGDTIPITQISWTVSAANSNVPGVIPAGTFTAGTQTLATVSANTYIENCHTFIYANSAVRAQGTYTGRVTYTLTSP